MHLTGSHSGRIQWQLKVGTNIHKVSCHHCRKLTFAEDVTPYIHTFVFHCPEFVSMYGGLGAFSMEEVERLNKINKSCFFRKTHQGSDPNASSWQVK